MKAQKLERVPLSDLRVGDLTVIPRFCTYARVLHIEHRPRRTRVAFEPGEMRLEVDADSDLLFPVVARATELATWSEKTKSLVTLRWPGSEPTV